MLESPNRQMPHSTDAEQAILGAMLLDEKVCEDVKLKLQPDDFYHHRHRIIYETMLILLDQNIGVDVTTVTAYLQDHKMCIRDRVWIKASEIHRNHLIMSQISAQLLIFLMMIYHFNF